MKKFFASLITCCFLLTSCSFLGGGGSSSGEKDKGLTDFNFVTDSKFTIDSSGDEPFYLLTMYVGDTYQVKTDVDNKIGQDYYFEYSDYDQDIINVSTSGLVNAINKGLSSVRVKLLRKKDSKRIDYDYFIVNIKEHNAEYANISINDASLPYDEETRTYYLSLKGGESYSIPTSVKYNTPYNKVFSLVDASYSLFMDVSSSGYITTQKVNEDKDGQVVIKTVSTDNTTTYDTIYLNVHVIKNEDVTPKELEVTNLATGTKLNDGDNLFLYIGESLSYSVKYGGISEYGVSEISNVEVLSLDNNLNKITALSAGKSDLIITCEDKSLTIHIEVLKDYLENIYAPNNGDDFVIVNNQLYFLGRMFAKYHQGTEIDITNSNNLSFVISSSDTSYKSVKFTYVDGEDSKDVTYLVRYFISEEYQESESRYNYSDYFNNCYANDCSVLPKEGEIHMLVIPIWFTNSTSFFREDQKQEIVDDLEYVYNTERDIDLFHSVKQFYEEESNGKLIFNITVSDFYESNTSSKNYGDTLEDDIVNTHTLTDNAITWYFNNHQDESIADYDSNNDGLVDAVSLVYAANYYGTIGDQNGTTAFQFKNSKGNSHKYNNGSFSPIGGIYGFNKTSDPSIQLNVTDLSKYYPSYFFNSGNRTIIHETGHMFGFADLYEDNHAQTKYYPAGRFSMQSSNYGGHDPYQMNLVGWSTPQIYSASDYEVGDKITININDFVSTGNNILLTREMNEYNSLFDEYLLLELLAPTGLNYFDSKYSPFKFSDAGIRLWHVNSILEDLSHDGKETSEVSNNTWSQLKYSNNDQSSKFDLAHWIRNNPEEAYDTVSTVNDGYGLFKSGDHFDMSTYQSQFVNGDKLDNKEKLGWEFDVETIYQTAENTYGAIITLTRVENERSDFDFESRINKDIDNQPTEDGIDYAKELLGDDELFSLIYNFNDAEIPSYYTQGKPISSRGVCLFASPNGNGGSLILSIKEKDGYRIIITSVSITYTMLTKATISAIIGGEITSGTSFTGPYNQYDEYNEKGMTYEVNNSSITFQNKYSDGTDYWSVLAIYSLSISYHIEKI